MAEFQFQNDELELVDDYYYFETNDSDDDDTTFPFSESSTPRSADDEDDPFASDFDDDFDDVVKVRTDTTAGEARKGKDMQGIPWERLNFTRDKYRETRLQQYKNYQSIPSSSSSLDELHKDCKQVEKGHNFYDFQFNTRLIKSTIVHFQISEGLIVATLAILLCVLQH